MVRRPLEKPAGDEMYESTQDAAWVCSIDLAREVDFDLGSLRVRPARCEVERDGVSRGLQRRVMQVLVALADAKGSVVSQEELVDRCWNGLSVSDDAIYRCISKLRKLAADYPEPPFAIDAIPGVGYRLTASELVTADPATGSAAPGVGRSYLSALIVLAALFLLVAAGAALWKSNGRAEALPSARVAVQAFETLNESPGTRSLARMIPNEIVDALGDSQVETVLTDDESSRAATGPAGAAAGLIVTGLLRSDENHVIVDVRLEDGATRAALWSTEFKRDGREALDLPMEVAARVADVVSIANFARSAHPPLTDGSALTPLLQTTDMIRDAGDGAWAPMLEKARGVVARHPDFAFGHSVLAAAYAEAARSIDVPDRARALNDAARREAKLTLKLDPLDAGAYAVLSELEPTYDFARREAILLQGIRRAKHPKEPLGALYSYTGTLLSNVGRLREALNFQLIARATDEWGPPKTVKLALTYASAGNVAAARRWMRMATQRWPNHTAVRAARLTLAGFYEPPPDALAIIDAVDAGTFRDEDQPGVWRTFVEAKAARSRDVTDAAIGKIREAAGEGRITRETEVMMLAGLGETRQAIAAANLALDRQVLEPRILFTPVMRDVRRDPGFVRIASRMGLISYWRETGKRPDFCARPANPDACSPQLSALLR